MRTTEKLENVIDRVHEISANNHDEIIPIREMQFENLNRVQIADLTFGVLPSAQRLIANRLRIPFSYLNRCPEHLQRDNIQFWLEQERNNRETLFCRFAGNNLRAVFTERYKVIDNLMALSKMLEYGFNPATEVHLSLDNEIMVMKVPEYERLFRLSEDDKIVPGISIANSEVGILALSVSAFYFRLVCSNGMIAKTSVDARYKHISCRVMDEFPMVLESVVAQSRNGHERFRISMQTHVDNPESTITTFARQFQLSQNEVEIVKQAFYQESGGTMFHIIQAFTRGAQNPILSATDSYRLEKAGGQILALVK